MSCCCGGRLEHKEREADAGVVTVYDKCAACGLVRIHRDLTGRAVRQALEHNLRVIEVMRNGQ